MSGTNKLDVTIVDINKNNIEQLRVINTSTLPVRYTDKFYKDLIEKGFPEYLKFATWNGFTVAAVCARIEPHETIPDSFKLYIMTINVLAAYRRRGIGTCVVCCFAVSSLDTIDPQSPSHPLSHSPLPPVDNIQCPPQVQNC